MTRTISRAGRKKRWSENMQARFPEGTFARIASVLAEGEDRTDFIRAAVSRELDRRTRGQRTDDPKFPDGTGSPVDAATNASDNEKTVSPSVTRSTSAVAKPTTKPAEPGKITFSPQEGGGYVVWSDDERIGFVRQVDRGAWAATDTFMVALRGTYATRKRAVEALRRRFAKASR